MALGHLASKKRRYQKNILKNHTPNFKLILTSVNPNL